VKRHLRIVIEAGEHTCRAASDSPWCPFVRVCWQGIWDCDLFDKRLPNVNQDGTPATSFQTSWAGRLPECKAAEGNFGAPVLDLSQPPKGGR
jgi:hypothetical protein